MKKLFLGLGAVAAVVTPVVAVVSCGNNKTTPEKTKLGVVEQVNAVVATEDAATKLTEIIQKNHDVDIVDVRLNLLSEAQVHTLTFYRERTNVDHDPFKDTWHITLGVQVIQTIGSLFPNDKVNMSGLTGADWDKFLNEPIYSPAGVKVLTSEEVKKMLSEQGWTMDAKIIGQEDPIAFDATIPVAQQVAVAQQILKNIETNKLDESAQMISLADGEISSIEEYKALIKYIANSQTGDLSYTSSPIALSSTSQEYKNAKEAQFPNVKRALMSVWIEKIKSLVEAAQGMGQSIIKDGDVVTILKRGLNGDFGWYRNSQPDGEGTQYNHEPNGDHHDDLDEYKVNGVNKSWTAPHGHIISRIDLSTGEVDNTQSEFTE